MKGVTTSLMLIAGLSLAIPAMAAKPPHAHVERFDIPVFLAEARIGPKQAARRAQKQHGGRVLSVKLKAENSDNPYYAVKLIKKGKVSVLRIPAN